MSALVAPESEVSSWVETCKRYDDEWVCLTDIDAAEDGSIHSARVLGHSANIDEALAQVRHLLPPATQMRISLVNTKGRRLRQPRMVMSDELRDFLQSQPGPGIEFDVR